jgi:hypothetical protein
LDRILRNVVPSSRKVRHEVISEEETTMPELNDTQLTLLSTAAQR